MKSAYFLLVAVLVIVLVEVRTLPEKKSDTGKVSLGEKVQEEVSEIFQKSVLSAWAPAFLFGMEGKSLEEQLQESFFSWTPFGMALSVEEPVRLQTESGHTYESIVLEEGKDEDEKQLSLEELEMPERSEGRIQVDDETADRMQRENESARNDDLSENELSENDADNMLSQNEPDQVSENALNMPEIKQIYDWEYFEDYDALVGEFYAIDATTAADSSLLNLEKLLNRDLSIEKRQDEKPQILVYHTHSQEGFVDSVEGDVSTGIVGVGEELTRILREDYGYEVLHHTGEYDVEARDYAYSNSLPAIEQLLAENPTIEVVIDLHRDEVAADRKLVVDIDGKPTAMFMFFNGLSRTRKLGEIEYLPNENLQDNLAFSFQMQTLCNTYYPGLTRRIYLKGYRYNMHLKARYLLIEMGAQTNTYTECINACEPLAKMLHLELSGAEFDY